MSTESAAVSFVTEKLQAHGYEVVDKNIEKPNHRTYDLVARKAGVEALVEVKGLQKPTPWLVKPAKDKFPNLFYALVVLNPQRAFVLSQDEIATVIEAYRVYRGPGQTDPLIGKSFLFWQAAEFENQWDKLPGWTTQ
jgi:hypothetical protein